MGKGQPWLIEDEEFLRENYIDLSKEELIERFNTRTWKGIKHKANDMGIKKRNNYEDIPLDELYKIENGIKYKKCKCCRRYLPFEMIYFPKDDTCIDGFRYVCKECKGENFGLSNAIDWTDEDVELLKEVYSSMINEEIIKEYFPNRKLKHLTDKASKLGLKKDKETFNRSRVMSHEGRIRVSNARKIEGAFKGVNNPMFNSHRVGKLNPNWKGGITSEKRKIMNGDEYKQWRQAVFERDNYTCQCCGRQTHNNEAHHLDNFADYEEQRFDINNGITLCKQCHNPNQEGSFHNTYGTLHNTREQYEEYEEMTMNEFNKKDLKVAN